MIKISQIMLLLFLFFLLPLKASNDKLIEKNLTNKERELYLVVIYNVSHSDDEPKNRTQFEATIVKVVRGSKKIGSKIRFSRVYETIPADVDKLKGEMFYVAYDKAPMNGSPNQGQLYVDEQHPERFFKYSAERSASN